MRLVGKGMIMRRYYVLAVVATCLALSFLPTSLNAAQTVGSTIENTETNPVPVKNVNTETNPVPTYNIEHPAKIDFEALCNMPLGANNQSDECSIDVPAGERYIVEFVSAGCVT